MGGPHSERSAHLGGGPKQVPCLGGRSRRPLHDDMASGGCRLWGEPGEAGGRAGKLGMGRPQVWQGEERMEEILTMRGWSDGGGGLETTLGGILEKGKGQVSCPQVGPGQTGAMPCPGPEQMTECQLPKLSSIELGTEVWIQVAWGSLVTE